MQFLGQRKQVGQRLAAARRRQQYELTVAAISGNRLLLHCIQRFDTQMVEDFLHVGEAGTVERLFTYDDELLLKNGDGICNAIGCQQQSITTFLRNRVLLEVEEHFINASLA